MQIARNSNFANRKMKYFKINKSGTDYIHFGITQKFIISKVEIPFKILTWSNEISNVILY